MSFKCIHCGKTLPDTAKFCSSCGKPTAQVSQPAPIQQVQNTVPNVHTLPKKKSNTALIAVILVFALILGSLVAVPLFIFLGNEGAVGGNEIERTEDNTADNEVADPTTPTDEPEPRRDIGKTVMIYIVGSDLESDNGAASSDIEEMLDSGVDTDVNNILIYTGGANDWEMKGISDDNNMIFRIDDKDLDDLKTYSDKNMGKSSTLAEFINYGTENYPSEQYGLILWDHGAGPLQGYGFDEKTDDFLSLDEIADALDDTDFGNGSKLEFIGFDACLMGSLEIASCLSEYANYLIASQEVEPGWGWDYGFLSDLQTYQNGEEVGTAVIDSYFTACEDYFEMYPFSETDITLSCLDLSCIDDTEKCLDELFSVVNADILQGAFPSVSKYRYNTKSFAKFSDDFSYDLIDLNHIVSLLSSDYSDEADALSEALEELICYSRANVALAYGVSIYHPYDNIYYSDYWLDYYDTLDFAPEYTEYINNFEKLLTGDSTTDWDSFSTAEINSQQIGENSIFSIQLTEEQAADIAGAEYHVFCKLTEEEALSSEDEYWHIFSGINTTLDNDGTLSVAYNGKAVYGIDESTKESTNKPLPVNQLYDVGDNLKYVMPCIFTSPIDDRLPDPVVTNWQIKVKGDTPVLLSAYENSGDSEGVPEKQLIDPNDYSKYQFSAESYTVDESGDQTMISTGNIYYYEFTKEDGFHLELKDVDDISNYYAYITVTDIHGNKYTSRLVCLG